MRIVLVFAMFLASCSTPVSDDADRLSKANVLVQSSPSASPTLSPTPNLSETFVADIPKDTWEKLFFESINERSARTKIKPLRSKYLRETDIEIRVWEGFGMTALVGWSIRRIDGEWSAAYFGTDFVSKKWVYADRSIGPPKSGWDLVWKKLLSEEILILPDAVSINCDPRMNDGIAYVVEIRKGKAYRTYQYGNPDAIADECREAKQMENIARIFREEFEGI